MRGPRVVGTLIERSSALLVGRSAVKFLSRDGLDLFLVAAGHVPTRFGHMANDTNTPKSEVFVNNSACEEFLGLLSPIAWGLGRMLLLSATAVLRDLHI